MSVHPYTSSPPPEPSKYSKANASPAESEIMTLERPVASPSISNSIMVPQPLNVAPVSEKPRTVVELAEIMKPAASASPPEALTTEPPSTSN